MSAVTAHTHMLQDFDSKFSGKIKACSSQGRSYKGKYVLSMKFIAFNRL